MAPPARGPHVAPRSEQLDFHVPARQGPLVELVVCMVGTSRSSLRIQVELHIEMRSSQRYTRSGGYRFRPEAGIGAGRIVPPVCARIAPARPTPTARRRRYPARHRLVTRDRNGPRLASCRDGARVLTVSPGSGDGTADRTCGVSSRQPAIEHAIVAMHVGGKLQKRDRIVCCADIQVSQRNCAASRVPEHVHGICDGAPGTQAAAAVTQRTFRRVQQIPLKVRGRLPIATGRQTSRRLHGRYVPQAGRCGAPERLGTPLGRAVEVQPRRAVF